MLFLRYTLFVAVGGAVGATARYWTNEFVHMYFERGFPLGTLLVNVVGSFIMGFLAMIMLHKFPQHIELKSFILIGMLGAFTTFSTFSLDTVNLFTAGQYGFAVLNILLSIVLCIIVAGFGVYLGIMIR